MNTFLNRNIIITRLKVSPGCFSLQGTKIIQKPQSFPAPLLMSLLCDDILSFKSNNLMSKKMNKYEYQITTIWSQFE